MYAVEEGWKVSNEAVERLRPLPYMSFLIHYLSDPAIKVICNDYKIW